VKKRLINIFGIIITITLSVNAILHGQGVDDDIMKKLFGNNAAEKASALAHIDKEKPRNFIELLREKIKITGDLETKLTVIEALSKYPIRPLIPVWIELLKEEESFPVKKRIIDFISQSSDRRIVMPLVDQLSSPFSTVRESAILALKRLGDDRMFPTIFNMAGNQNPIYRVYALEAMFHLYDRRMGGLIRELLADKNKSVRYYALKCIENNRLNETIPQVRNIALNDANWEVRIKAIEVIREFRDAGSLYVVLRCVSDENRDVRHAASLTLLDFRNSSTAHAVSNQLDIESDNQIKNMLMEILISVKNAGGFRGLERVLLHESDADLRIKAAFALGFIGDIRGASLLLKGLEDRDYRIRAEVCASLGNFKNNAAVINGLLDRVNHDEFRYARSAALYSLERIGDRRVLLPLYDLYTVETDPLFRDRLKSVVRGFINR